MYGLTFALALAFAAPAPASSDPPVPSQTSPHGGFVDLGWRAYGLAGHFSHGPGFAAGAIIARYFEIGIAGIARPGPINPRTFSVALPDGQTYRGKSTLKLRSDGTAMGLLLGARVPLRSVPIEFEFPVMVGYGGFGFYLHGNDRKTPDGRRVSEWEDELLDGRDADANNLVLDVGMRIALAPRRTPHLRPYLGVHYTLVTPYDTDVLTDYSGFSGSIGIRFGRFPGAR